MRRKESTSKNNTFELISDDPCEIGENPLWHPLEKNLYWTDISAGRLFRFDPAAGHHEQCYKGRPVGGFTVQQDGSLLLFKDRGTITSWRGGEESTIVGEIEAELSLRFNDVIADPRGRVFCGTFARGRKGRLYRLDIDGSLHLILDDIGCSNGMAFTPDLKHFFHTDSFAGTVYQFNYDQETGRLANRRIFASVPRASGFPDGCTVDAEGCFWYALWGGSMLVRLDPKGRHIESIAVPAQKVTSLTFAGDDLKDIYLTSEGGRSRSKADPYAGGLFRIESLVAGKPEFLSRVTIGDQHPASRSTSH